MPDPPTNVIFRRWKKPAVLGVDGIIAIFPDIAGNDRHDGCVMMYEHVGQHGAGDYLNVMENTRPAGEREPAVMKLKAELERIGYVLRIRRRANWDTLGRER